MGADLDKDQDADLEAAPSECASPRSPLLRDITAVNGAEAMWKMAPLAPVIDETIKGIEHRAAQIAVPGSLDPVAQAPASSVPS
jgi:hypothetical protein